MMAPIDLSEKLLSETGGWQVMKQARTLADAGAVLSAEYAPPILKGAVREGGRELRAGLRIVTRTNVENLCTCRASREWGTICAHSIAVGLAALRRNQPQAPNSPQKPAAASAASAASAVSQPKPQPAPDLGPKFVPAGTPGAVPVTFRVILPPSLEAAIERGRVMVVLEAEVRAKRLMAHALDPKLTYSCTPRDLALVAAGKELGAGTLAGMIEAAPESLGVFLQRLQAAGVVATLGREKPADLEALIRVCQPTGVAGQETTVIPLPAAGQPSFTLELEGSLNNLSATLTAHYPDREFRVASSGSPSSPVRNPSAENSAIDRLRQCGFGHPNLSGVLEMRGEGPILRFYAVHVPELQKAWQVRTGTRFQNVTRNVERISPRLEIRPSAAGWFEMDLNLTTPSGERFSAAEIHQLLNSGKNHLRLKNQRTAVFDDSMLNELQEVIRDCDPQQVRPGTYRVRDVFAGAIAETGEGTQVIAPSSWLDWANMLRDPSKLPVIELGRLASILRSYQQLGVFWMHFLANQGLGGLLADEMGLGKTLQSLAYLATRSRQGPSLVVCPSSLVYNWNEEAQRFTPELRRMRWDGPERRRVQSDFDSADLVITSYAILRRDADWLSQFQFDSVFLDEAQHVKNPETQGMQAATSLRARHRFVLTGTPVENSIRDLWSLMNFAMPGLLGSQRDFREQYERPDPAEQIARAKLVKRRIRPFLLRRSKKDAATELPEKIVQVAHCELNADQSEIYRKLLQRTWEDLDKQRKTGTEAQRRITALTALMRLRQACCDLRLLSATQGGERAATSGKTALLFELLREAQDGNHKVLVFSQFASMLRILSSDLEAQGVDFCYLDGQSRDRAEQVQRFQSEQNVPVFLISLKAGGVGLNLQAADTVVHFDPWWNPAAEAQATDRAHRIGQTKVVTAYKLITKGTVEERILALQARKRELFELVADSAEDESNPDAQRLSMDDLEELLQ